MENYKLQKKLGDGTYGFVYRATNIATGQVVAIKKFKHKYTSWEECTNLKEVKALQKLKHPNIIKLIEVFREKDELYLVFEFLDNDIYQAYLEKKNNGKFLPEDKIRAIIKQVAEGLAYMHRQGFFHRDMKPENLLVKGETVKICDFGLAREIRSRPPYTEYVSTRWYRAPEILLSSKNYNSPVDIFALGCIMAELYTLNPLFNGSSQLDQLYKVCNILGTPNTRDWPEVQKLATASNITLPNCQPQSLEKIIPQASPQALDLIKEMLQYDPQKRISAKSILEHPYFSQNVVHIPQLLQNQEKIEKPKRNESSHQKPIELPKIIGKENKNKFNESNSKFFDQFIEQKLAEYDRPKLDKVYEPQQLQQSVEKPKLYSHIEPINTETRQKRDSSFHKQQSWLEKKQTFEQQQQQQQQQELQQIEQRIESKKQNKGKHLNLLKYNDPLGDQLQQQMHQSRSYEPTKRKIYDFQLMPQVTSIKSNYQPKLELLPPKQHHQSNMPPLALPRPQQHQLGFKYQQQFLLGKPDDYGINRQNKLYQNY